MTKHPYEGRPAPFAKPTVKAGALLSMACALFLSAQSHADCNELMKANILADQYFANEDGSVTDQATGLDWKRCPEGYDWFADLCVAQPSAPTTFTWGEALNHTAPLTEASGWRLPNTKELESLLKRNCSNPAIETTVFSSLELLNHWTSTAAVGYEGSAWAVNFIDGGHITADKESEYMIRLVRSQR